MRGCSGLAVAAVVAAAIAAGEGVARAAPPATVVPPAVATGESDVERGKAHYHAGAEYYQEARYEDALREFNEAYRLSKKPPLLFNISLCQERLGRLDDAIASLERYLGEDPETADRNVVEARLTTFRATRAAKLAAAAPTVKPPPPPPPQDGPPRKRRVTWVVGGAGVLLLGGALIANLIAGSRLDSLHRRCDASGGCDFSDAQSTIDSGLQAAYASYVLVAVGAAAVAAGVVLFFLEGRRRPSGAHAAVAPFVARGGAGLVLGGSF